MTIGSPSGSGATQNDIADGADKSDSRWLTIYKGGLTASQPDQIATDGIGTSPSFGASMASINSSSGGDEAAIYAGGNNTGEGNSAGETASVIVKTRYVSEVDISTLADDHFIGYFLSVNPTRTVDDMAAFHPTAGDNTDGNVFVDSAGSETTGSVSYPTLTNLNSYTLLIDFAGNYLSAGSTGFYINKDPRRGDDPNIELNDTPQAANRGLGIAYHSNGSAHGLNAQFLEVAHRQ